MAVMLTMDNSLSIVPSGEGNPNDFPVLKAFQEYIDAEQAKARKRMLGLSVFFIILLVVVVCTFALVLTVVVNRNQALSDKLLDYALNDSRRSSQPPVQVVAPQPQPQVSQSALQDMMKPIIERLEREQAAMKSAYEKQQENAKALAEAKEKAQSEELRKAREELRRERELAKREADRQAEIERHRRRLYPDYYNAREEAPRPSRTVQPAEPIQREQPKSRDIKPSSTPKEKTSTPSLSDIKPITYFDSADDDGVPFLLETPSESSRK